MARVCSCDFSGCGRHSNLESAGTSDGPGGKRLTTMLYGDVLVLCCTSVLHAEVSC